MILKQNELSTSNHFTLNMQGRFPGIVKYYHKSLTYSKKCLSFYRAGCMVGYALNISVSVLGG